MQINSDILRLMSSQTAIYSPAIGHSSNDVTTQNAIRTLNDSNLLGSDRELKFSKAFRSNLDVVQVLDRTNGEVVAQIPTEAVVNLAEALQSSAK